MKPGTYEDSELKQLDEWGGAAGAMGLIGSLFGGAQAVSGGMSLSCATLAGGLLGGGLAFGGGFLLGDLIGMGIDSWLNRPHYEELGGLAADD